MEAERWQQVEPVATDSQSLKRVWKGGHSESDRESRRAELEMVRNTNLRLNRRKY